jgi:hypothetical protein
MGVLRLEVWRMTIKAAAQFAMGIPGATPNQLAQDNL